MIRAVILDLGNVLAFHDNALLFRRLGERAGRDPAAVERLLLGPGWLAANLGELDEEGIRASVCSALGVELPPGELDALWSSHFRVHREVLPAVEALVGRVKLLCLSNTNALHARFLRAQLPILGRFDHLLFSCEVGMAKPDPAFFREALRRAGTAPSETAFFDDVAEYVAAASALGIAARLFTDAKAFSRQLAELGLS